MCGTPKQKHSSSKRWRDIMALPQALVSFIIMFSFLVYYGFVLLVLHQWGRKKVYPGKVIRLGATPTRPPDSWKQAPSADGEKVPQKIALTGFCVNVGADMGSTYVNPLA